MELKIEHIAPYLPYQLEGYCIVNIHTIVEFIKPNRIGGITKFGNHVPIADTFKGFKPLLRPLSQFGEADDLRKVHEFVGLGNWCDAYDEYFKAWFGDAANVEKLVLQAPYEIFQYFLSEHYDVFELIKNGLATIK